jgi:hypothetical protein
VTQADRNTQTSPFDQLEEPILNAGLAIIDAMQPRSELQVLLAVLICGALNTGIPNIRIMRFAVAKERAANSVG